MSTVSNAQQLQRRNRELSILNTFAQALNRSLDLGEILRVALAQVAELLDLDTGWIWLLSEETGQPYLAATQNLPPVLVHNPRHMEGSCYCLDTYEQGDLEGAANVNVITCSRLKYLIDGTDGLRYHSSIPLYAHGKQLGVLNLASTDWRELSADDLRLLYTVGDLLSIAIERTRLFASSVQLGAVEERNRLAREIHDTLAQGLTAITLQLESADALLDNQADPKSIQQIVQKALALTQANLEEARRSVLDLRAAPLEGRTLSEALDVLVRRWAKETGIETSFDCVGGNHPLPIRIEVGLYRIAQEALTNAGRHAGATRVNMHLTITPESVQLLVEDDGKGFDPDRIREGRFGLLGLSERARLLGGQLRLESGPGAGTRIEVSIST